MRVLNANNQETCTSSEPYFTGVVTPGVNVSSSISLLPGGGKDYGLIKQNAQPVDNYRDLAGSQYTIVGAPVISNPVYQPLDFSSVGSHCSNNASSANLNLENVPVFQRVAAQRTHSQMLESVSSKRTPDKTEGTGALFHQSTSSRVSLETSAVHNTVVNYIHQPSTLSIESQSYNSDMSDISTAETTQGVTREKLSALPAFDGNTSFPNYLIDFEERVTLLKYSPEEKFRALVKNLTGTALEYYTERYNVFKELTTNGLSNYGAVIALFRNAFYKIPTREEALKHIESLPQYEDEKLDDYVFRVGFLSIEAFEFQSSQRLARKYFIAGLRDKTLALSLSSRDMASDSSLTLYDLLQKAKELSGTIKSDNCLLDNSQLDCGEVTVSVKDDNSRSLCDSVSQSEFPALAHGLPTPPATPRANGFGGENSRVGTIEQFERQLSPITPQAHDIEGEPADVKHLEQKLSPTISVSAQNFTGSLADSQEAITVENSLTSHCQTTLDVPFRAVAFT